MTSRSPLTTVSRNPGSTDVSSTPAPSAVLLTGTPCGPSPVRTPNTETLRSKGTVLPAVASTATDDASSAVRSSVRLPGPAPGSEYDDAGSGSGRA